MLGVDIDSLWPVVVYKATVHIAVLLNHLLDDRVDPGGGAFVVAEVDIAHKSYSVSPK